MEMKKILSRINIALAALAALTLLTACSKDDNGANTRTVLVYMSAENSLSPDSQVDLYEIMEGSKRLGTNDRLIVFYDRAMEDELPWLARIVNGELQDSVSVADMRISNKDDYASDPNIFEKVLTYAYRHYPATGGYGLVLWGHATGWIKEDSIAHSRAYGIDNGINSPFTDMGYWLNIPTLRQILERQPHLDFILADCCNFMCIESIYELREVTDYIVGSPAEVPEMGAPYEEVVPEMFRRGGAAQGILRKYANYYPGYLPLAVAKTEGMNALAEATRTVLTQIYSRMQAEYPDLTGLIHYYNDYKYRFYYYYNIFYDMGDFIKRFATDEEYRTWKAALDRVVTDKAFATTWQVNKTWYTHYVDFEMKEELFHGVSMFVPQDPGFGYYVRYNENIKMMSWWWKVWE